MEPESQVVAAVDFSDISPAVVTTALRLAKKIGAGCRVVHVVEALQGGEEEGPLLPSLRRWVKEVGEEAERQLDELVRSVDRSDEVPLRAEVLPGPVLSRLIRDAREQGGVFLVLGGPPPTRQLGSNAERVVRKSPFPVLVVRRPVEAGYRRVLVGVDFSAGSEKSLRLAHRLAEPDAEVTACHVIHAWGLPRPEEVREARRSARDRLRLWVADRLPDRPVACRTMSGTPKTALLGLVREIGSELLVVGSRGRSQLNHLLLGSVAENAVRRGECDVLVAGEERTDFCLP